ncbi:glycosyltransferase family 2 protein, partial [Granulicatella sp.]
MISVIVPVYNVEEYLEECLDSIKYQTHKNIEVILVNDGSTDNSKEICEKYCRQDNRFKLINQENQGLSEARNVGVRE